MAKIFAMGNALLDSEFLLNDEQLAQTGLTKANMTLASHSEQQDLVDNLASQNITASKQTSGGSAANSVFAMANLGCEAFYACRVGDDKAGEIYLADLNNHGVATSNNSVAIGGTTGSCMVFVTPDGERTMQTHLGTSAELNEKDIDFAQFANANWLYIEGYLAMTPSVQPAIALLQQQARQQGTKIAVSFADPAVVKFAKEGLDAWLVDGVDVVFCNREEAEIFTGESDHQKATQALLKVAKMAVVTNGANGTCVAFQDGYVNENHPENIVKIDTPNVEKVLDTNGAGDNFAGAFLSAWTQGYPIAQSGLLASVVASEVIQQIGARLPADQYQTIKNKIIVN